MSAPDFDWANDESVVLHNQSAIAVYPNNMGTIVVRQERSWDEDEDTIIVTASLEAAEAVAHAIIREVEAIRAELGQMPRELPKDRTAADRQRRRRNKQRDSEGAVTGCEWPDHSAQDTPTAELNGILFGPEGPDLAPQRSAHRDTRDKDRDASVTASAA